MKLTKKDFMKMVKEEGQIELENNLKYVVVKANKGNIEMTEKFEKQLTDERLYNEAYIGFVTAEEVAPYGMDNLPIYGGGNEYATNCFSRDMEKAIMNNLNDRQMGLLKRVK